LPWVPCRISSCCRLCHDFTLCKKVWMLHHHGLSCVNCKFKRLSFNLQSKIRHGVVHKINSYVSLVVPLYEYPYPCFGSCTCKYTRQEREGFFQATTGGKKAFNPSL
jgi:hypothetical protein